MHEFYMVTAGCPQERTGSVWGCRNCDIELDYEAYSRMYVSARNALIRRKAQERRDAANAKRRAKRRAEADKAELKRTFPAVLMECI